MKRYITGVVVLLLAGMLVSCGGGGDSPSGGGSPGATNGGNPGNSSGGNPGNDSGGSTGTLPSAGTRVEEDAAVSLSAGWTQSDPRAGWSGGAAVQSTVVGETASFTFTGTSVRWLSKRGRDGGLALVRVDGGEAKKVDLFARPNDEYRTPAITIYGLSDGPHTLTIEVIARESDDLKNGASAATSNVVVVDAFEVEPQIVSHVQEADPDLIYSAGWTQAPDGFTWSGGGAFNFGEPPPGAKVTEKAGETVTLKFRGTSISWRGYRGPDAGIARVQVDGGKISEVDTYSETFKVQEVLFTATGLADASHTLTIEATGRKNDKSTAAKIFVDAFDVTTPGRRYEDRDPKKMAAGELTYFGSWEDNNARVWSEGSSRTSRQPGATVTFTFTGTSVSWIGCEKASAGGPAKIYLDGAFVKEVSLFRHIPIEGYQRTIFRADGLTNGPHTLMIEVTSTDGAYVVVDAFDVHP